MLRYLQFIRKTLTRSKFDKISKLDDITNRILKTCFQKLNSLLTSLFQACVTLKYHSRVFKETHSITLKKLNKSNYYTSKIYRFIILLNMLNKVLKTVMTNKITYLAKKFKLFSNTQIRIRRNRSTKSALKLLIEQIHTIWSQDRNKVVTLLSMNVVEIYSTVFHRRLLYNMRKRKISQWITAWVASFLNDRRLTIVINDYTTSSFLIRTNIC